MELSLLSSEIEKYVILKQECWNLSYFRKQVRGTEDQLTSSKFKWWNRNQMWTKNKNWQQFQHFLIKEVLFYLKWNLTESFQCSIFSSLIFHVRDKVFWYKTTRYSWCWCMICLVVQPDMRCWSSQCTKRCLKCSLFVCRSLSALTGPEWLRIFATKTSRRKWRLRTNLLDEMFWIFHSDCPSTNTSPAKFKQNNEK